MTNIFTKNLMKKIIGFLVVFAMFFGTFLALPKNSNAQIVSGLWFKGSNGELYTNPVGSTINVGACNGCGGGGGTPGGLNTNVQFNDSGVFGGVSDFIFNKVSKIFSVGDLSSTANETIFSVNDSTKVISGVAHGSGTDTSNLLVNSGVAGIFYTDSGNTWGFAGSAQNGGTALIASATTTWAWPQADGNSGEVLGTDGAGGLSFLPGSGTDTSTSVGVRAASTAALPFSPAYDNGVDGVGATLTGTSNGTINPQDGISLIVTDRILVKDQVTQLQNGVYSVTQVGDAGNPYILTRTTDADETDEFDDQIVIPTEGTMQANQIFGQTTESPVIGTDTITYDTVTSLYVTQSITGTQGSKNLAFWTANPRQLNRGYSGLKALSNNWATGFMRIGRNNQGGKLVFRSGANADPVFIGYDGATNANQFSIDNSHATGVIGLRTTNQDFIVDNTNGISANTNVSFNVFNNMGSNYFEVIPGNQYGLGDLDGQDAGTAFRIDDAAQEITFDYNGDSYTFPVGDGNASEVLTTDGAGQLSWAAAGGTTLWSLNGAGTLYDDRAGNGTMSGAGNFLAGLRAGEDLTTAEDNTFIGEDAGQNTQDGSDNIFIGNYAGNTNVSGIRNVFLGRATGFSLTSGQYNFCALYQACYSLTTGQHNFMVGENAGILSTASYNIFLGREAGRNNTTGGYNIFLGDNAGYNTSTGDSNIFLGRSAGYTNTTGYSNVFVGSLAGGSNTVGLTNVFIGTESGADNTDGSANTFVGNESGDLITTGYQNTFLGANSGDTGTTAIRSIALGYNSDVAISGADNAIAIGHGAVATSNSIALGLNASNDGFNEFALAGNITKWKFQGDSYTLPTAFPASSGSSLISSSAGVMTWGADMLQKSTGAINFVPRSTPPATPALGDVYVDSDSNEYCFYDGSTWTGLKAGGACS